MIQFVAMAVAAVGLVAFLAWALRRALGIRPEPPREATHICDVPWNGPRS